MKKLIFLFFLASILVSCSNDVERAITTDLQVEGRELFRTSLALEEGLRYAFYSFEEYHQALTDTLPGCPLIEISEFEQKVKLTFSNDPNCPSQKVRRTGVINLDFFSFNLRDRRVLLRYEDYQVNDFKIQGERVFDSFSNGDNQNSWMESFEDLVILDQFDNSTKITGNYEHQLLKVDNRIQSFTSSGNLSGRNLTGRPLRMTQIAPRQYVINCLDEGFVIARAGEEVWEIFRTSDRSLAHRLTLSIEDICNTKVAIQLSDGRLLSFSY